MHIYEQTMTYIIYKATNLVNGKSYIGYSENFNDRKIYHKGDSFNSNSKSYNFIFHKAIRKYGFENFEWIILYQSNDREFTLKIMETYFIKLYNSYYKDNKGYNMTLGGEGNSGGGWKHTEESKRKIGEKSKGRPKTAYQLEVMRTFNKGKIMPEETKKKISETKKLQGNTRTEKSKEKNLNTRRQNRIGNPKYGIVIIYPDNTEVITYNLSEFCEDNDLNYELMIYVLTGKQKHHKGLKCRRLLDNIINS